MKLDLCHGLAGGTWILGFTVEEGNGALENTLEEITLGLLAWLQNGEY